MEKPWGSKKLGRPQRLREMRMKMEGNGPWRGHCSGPTPTDGLDGGFLAFTGRGLSSHRISLFPGIVVHKSCFMHNKNKNQATETSEYMNSRPFGMKGKTRG